MGAESRVTSHMSQKGAGENIPGRGPSVQSPEVGVSCESPRTSRKASVTCSEPCRPRDTESQARWQFNMS